MTIFRLGQSDRSYRALSPDEIRNSGSLGWDSEGEAVAGFQANYGQIPQEVPAVADPASPQWFAIHVRSRHEKKVAEELQQRGISNFLPVVRQVRRWSDRKKIVELPLFSCYLFVQIVPSPPVRVSVLNFHGVLGFIGPHQGTPIPSEQIESI